MAQAKSNGISGIGIGASVAALAAAAAGAYYFYGSKDATKNRKNMKSWMVKAKGEVMEKMEQLKDVSQDSYAQVVDQVVEKYSKVKNVDPKEIAALAAELHGTWKRISGSLKPATQPRKQVTGKSRKPAAKR